MKTKVFFTLIANLLLISNLAYAATISGKVAFEGTAPTAAPLKMDADPTCAALHANGAVSEEVVVNSNGTLKNVLVRITKGLEGKTFPAPKDAVKFDQKGCAYTPHVLGVQAGQPVEIINSDNTLHNVHALGEKNPQFNLGMPIQNMKLKKTFAKPEIVKVKCDVHPWMNAYIGVVDNPFYAVTADDGSFELKNVPAGTYTVETWHEKYGPQTQEVTIGAEGETKEANFSYKA